MNEGLVLPEGLGNVRVRERAFAVPRRLVLTRPINVNPPVLLPPFRDRLTALAGVLVGADGYGTLALRIALDLTGRSEGFKVHGRRDQGGTPMNLEGEPL